MRIPFFILFVSLTMLSVVHGQVSARKGWWKFDDTSTVLKAEPGFGEALVLSGTHQIIQGPVTGNGAIKIGIGSYYKMAHRIPANGGGTRVNDYTLQFDFRTPAIDGWRCFFQTSVLNNSDGDCFINTAGNIGTSATGYSAYAVRANEWYRLVISVKNGTQFTYYLDGQLLKAGTVQTIDGRFALDTLLLAFADNDGEDKEIHCSELAIWDHALPLNEVQALGGYGHTVTAPQTTQLILIPYLQQPGTTSMYVCWHDTLTTLPRVDYGLTTALGSSVAGTNEIVAGAYRWHTVKVTGLSPNTEYFYKAVSGSGSSALYSFRTLPDSTYHGKIRFLLLSDTHSTDTVMAVKVIKEAKKKIQQLYGNDIHNQMNVVMHSGDLVVDGGNIIQWTDEYFAPMSPLSPSVPFMAITGNHEGENQNYYKYMRYDEVSGLPAANEKFWSMRIANTLFVGLNSNIISVWGTQQKDWLEQKLMQAEADSSIDFVFVMSHHFAITELWGEGITYDGGPAYINTQIYPVLKKYSKVVQHSYGHTHGYERGMLESVANNSQGDFRIVCGGGGGGPTDLWGAYSNTNFPAIQLSLDNYFFQLIEIDAAQKTYTSSMYSLGNANRSRNAELMDSWYRKANQPAPAPPVSSAPSYNNNNVVFNTSAINADSIMTTRIQFAVAPDFSVIVLDTMLHRQDVFKVDAQFNPIDLNKNIDLTHLRFPVSRFTPGTVYKYRVKYRDNNSKWSDWSNSTSFDVLTGTDNDLFPLIHSLGQNYPNPFNPVTRIEYQIPESNFVSIKVYDMLGTEISTVVNRVQSAGRYTVEFDGSKLSGGMYLYKIVAGNFISVKKMLLLK